MFTLGQNMWGVVTEQFKDIRTRCTKHAITENCTCAGIKIRLHRIFPIPGVVFDSGLPSLLPLSVNYR